MPDEPVPETLVLPVRTGSGQVPMPRAGSDPLASYAEGPIRALHQRWVTVVDGCFETEMECGDGEPVDALRTAWAHALEHSAELKRDLDAYRGDPVHDRLTEHHLLRLAQATGLMRPGHTVGEGLAEVGRVLDGVGPAAAERSTWLGRRRRAAEERRLIMASMRPS